MRLCAPSSQLCACVRACVCVKDGWHLVVVPTLVHCFYSLHRHSIGADEFLPALIYTVLHANPLQLSSNLRFIGEYRNPSKLMSEQVQYTLCERLSSARDCFLSVLAALSSQPPSVWACCACSPLVWVSITVAARLDAPLFVSWSVAAIPFRVTG